MQKTELLEAYQRSVEKDTKAMLERERLQHAQVVDQIRTTYEVKLQQMIAEIGSLRDELKAKESGDSRLERAQDEVIKLLAEKAKTQDKMGMMCQKLARLESVQHSLSKLTEAHEALLGCKSESDNALQLMTERHAEEIALKERISLLEFENRRLRETLPSPIRSSRPVEIEETKIQACPHCAGMKRCLNALLAERNQAEALTAGLLEQIRNETNTDMLDQSVASMLDASTEEMDESGILQLVAEQIEKLSSPKQPDVMRQSVESFVTQASAEEAVCEGTAGGILFEEEEDGATNKKELFQGGAPALLFEVSSPPAVPPPVLPASSRIPIPHGKRSNKPALKRPVRKLRKKSPTEPATDAVEKKATKAVPAKRRLPRRKVPVWPAGLPRPRPAVPRRKKLERKKPATSTTVRAEREVL